MVDAHLDAIYGAGMLDNASGSATILEIALKLAKTTTRNQLRYIWFGGEELGLFGSFHYTQALAPSELGRIVFDIDADVTATPNYVYAIADPANSGGVEQLPGERRARLAGSATTISRATSAARDFPTRAAATTAPIPMPSPWLACPIPASSPGRTAARERPTWRCSADHSATTKGTSRALTVALSTGRSSGATISATTIRSVLETVSKAVASVVFNLANDASLNAAAPRPNEANLGRSSSALAKGVLQAGSGSRGVPIR